MEKLHKTSKNSNKIEIEFADIKLSFKHIIKLLKQIFEQKYFE